MPPISGVNPGYLDLFVKPNGRKSSWQQAAANNLAAAGLIQVQTLASGLVVPVSPGQGALTGVNFGSNPDFAPVKFMDFAGLPEGSTFVQAGGTGNGYNQPSGTYSRGTYTTKVTNLDGISAGGGSWEKRVIGDNSLNGQFSDGPFGHEFIDVPGGADSLTVFKHVRFIKVSGVSPSWGAQYKGTRFTSYNHGDPSVEYGKAPGNIGNPRMTNSWWYYGGSHDILGHYFLEAGSVDLNTPGPPGPQAPRNFPFMNAGWLSTYFQGRMNSANGVADGEIREWVAGGYRYWDNDIDVRDNVSTKFLSVQPFPGFGNDFGSTGEYIIRHARIVVFKGFAWCAFGNAPTFSGVTELLAVEPTSWSPTRITFNRRGNIPSTHQWMYVMKSDGTMASASGSTSFT